MTRKSGLALLIAGAIGLLGAGCGSSSNSTTPAATATTGSTTPTTAPSNTTTATTSTSSNPTVAQAAARCKSAVEHAGLSGTLTSKLTGLCDQAAQGNVSAARQIVSQVCTQIVDARVPSGSPGAIRKAALRACKRAA